MKHLRRHIMFALLVCVTGVVFAQNEAIKVPQDTMKSSLYGYSAHLDIAAPIMGLAVDPGVITGEVSVDLNFLNRFFPIIELGYASINSQAANGSTYSAKAPFGRLGVNFNILGSTDKEADLNLNRNYAYLGVRYGMSVVNYELTNVPITNAYWNESQLLSWRGKNSYAGWGEVVAGIRVDMAQGFTMGWSVRMKLFLHSSLDDKQELWYVPGYGNSSGNTFTLNYTLGYTYYTKAERSKLKK